MTQEVGRGTVLAGRYRVVDPLPSDLEGVSVWRATDQILDRPVRVRVLESGAVAPALDAARRAALVTDARLVRVLDVGMHEGAGYVVSEQITGASLAQLVDRGALTPDQARAVVGEAAAALEVARRRGVHHLALRPSVVHVSADGRVLVSGLAIDAALLGTEQGDARATSRTDTVDLVRLLYTGLTGRWPGARDDVRAVTVPAAPVLDGAPVPPGEIVPGVPNDLDTLCAVTLGPNADGPYSPGDLVHELEPWGEIRIGRAADDPDDIPTAGAPVVVDVPAEGPERPAAPVRIARQSVRSAFDELPAGAPRPGTPPPAVPPRSAGMPAGGVQRTGVLPPAAGLAAGAGLAGGPAAAAPAFPPAAPPPVGPPGIPPAYEPGPEGWDEMAYEEEDPFAFVEEEPRRRFDPTALVLVLVGVVVLVGLVFAARSLFESPVGDVAADPEGTTTQEQPAASETAAPAPTPTPTAADPGGGPAPVISQIRTFDPTDPAGERVENVELAVDGDPTTFWFSYTYNRADFAGLKEGMGLELTLQSETDVSAVKLSVNGSGGNVEVRATTGSTPTQGELLASSALGPETDLTFAEPVRTSTLVLYFTELPTNPAGQFRIEVTEIAIS